VRSTDQSAPHGVLYTSLKLISFISNYQRFIYLFTNYLFIYLLFIYINPLNTELNAICHLMALLGAHHILHVSKIRVKTAPTCFDEVTTSSGSAFIRYLFPDDSGTAPKHVGAVLM
jgi:hypothetical protein